MAHRYSSVNFKRKGPVLFLLILGMAVLGPSGQADPPIGTFYYPPGNVPPGPPPNYNQIDSTYFAGEPALPLPPPDSGGVYIWVDSLGTWNIANHIYSKGNSLEQFHGSILARMETPPTPGLNVFAVNFEIFGDTVPQKCYLQNDRWGWYDWGNGLYEIWWDVCTREYRENSGDPNDFLIIKLVGCAIDFNIWSSGHSEPFGADQIFLGASKIPLSEVPEFEDTYPGIYDPYQDQAGNDPTTDRNITVFTRRDGAGATYNVDGLIVPGEAYPCGIVKDQVYGDRFSGSFVYEGNGVEFSSVCDGLEGPGLIVDDVEIPPLADEFTDVLVNICGGVQVWSLINEFTPWDDVNIFGYYDDLGAGNNRIIRFVGTDSMGYVDTTFINPGMTAGLWLHNDTNGDQAFNGDDALLFTERALTIGSGDNNHQWFMVYDVSAYKGTGATYNFFCPTQDYTFTGDFDYLIFIDDDNVSANFDHNDMMVGMLCYSAPVITCPPDVTIQCDGSFDPLATGFATATVSCGISPFISYSDSQNGDIIIRTWTATDDCGLTSSCQQIITLADTVPPAITTCPSDIAVQCSADIPAADINSVSASDNCDSDPVITHVSDVSDGNTCPEIITRTYRATDNAGNYAECSQVIIVDDNTAPILTCPSNITVDCGGSIDPANTGYAAATDNCTANPSITYSDVPNGHSITRAWSASDACGNSSQCTQIITLLDSTAPVIIGCPDDLSIQCITELPAPDVNAVFVTDNCDPDPVITHVSDISDGNTCPEIITRTYRATDNSGNYADCVQVFTIFDNIAPGITCPANLTISCSDPLDPAFTGYPEVSDNCDPAPEVSFIDDAQDQIIIRTWSVVDLCGNASQCVQTIAILENLPPIVECPTVTVTVITSDLADEICFGDIVHYDPDGELATVEVNGVVMSGTEICFIPQNWGINQVTIICTDDCGAASQCSFTVIVGRCYFLPGDANVDHNVNIADVVDMLNHLKAIITLPGGECDCTPDVPTVPFYGGADANGSCQFNVADVVYLYEYLRNGGQAVQYCPLCPPTEGWLPPLRGQQPDIKPMLPEMKKTVSND